jgi:iron complex outermembrane receptor protein
MNFHNEIAATGELSDIGLPLRRNVDRSYRRGIEINASWQLASKLQVRGNASFSRNRIHRWLDLVNVQPLLTPTMILNPAIEYTPSPRLSFGAVGRYVSKSFLDNTEDNSLITPPFFVVDATANYRWIRLQVNNLLNRKRVFPSGYAFDGVSFLYPLATRNAVLTLHFNL